MRFTAAGNAFVLDILLDNRVAFPVDLLMGGHLPVIGAGVRPLRGTILPSRRLAIKRYYTSEEALNGLIYLVGLIVVILAILSFFGLR